MVRALVPLADLCAALGLRLQIGGSVATSVYGVARTTLDVDVVLDLPLALVPQFVAGLEDEYMVEFGAVAEAVTSRSSFNIIHQPTVVKIDVFVPAVDGFARHSFERGISDSLEDSATAREFVFATPEDMILHKLIGFELGERVARRQWDDVVGVVAVMHANLDWSYIDRWGASLGLTELVDLLREAVPL